MLPVPALIFFGTCLAATPAAAESQTGKSPSDSGTGTSSVVTAIANKQNDVKRDQIIVAHDQMAANSAQAVVNKDSGATFYSCCGGNNLGDSCSSGGVVQYGSNCYNCWVSQPFCGSFCAPTCDADHATLTQAQQQLAMDNATLQTDNQQLGQLQAMLTQLETTDQSKLTASEKQALSGGGLDPFQSQANGASVRGVSMTPSQDDVAKLTGPAVVEGAQARDAAASTAGQTAFRAASLAPPLSRRADANPDILDARVAIPVSPVVPSGGREASPGLSFLRSAEQKFRMGDFKGALEDSLAAIKADPNNPLGYLRAAEAYNKLGDYASGERMARAALERDPQNPNAWKTLAWALLKQGKYKEALAAALMAAKLKPDMAEAWAIAAYASERLGDRSGAVEYLKKAAAADPSFQDQLATALRGGKVYAEEEADRLGLGAASRGRAPSPWPLLGGGAVALLSLAGGVWTWRRRRPGAMLSAMRPTRPTQRERPPMLGKYELGVVIGRGGMGEVFLGKDTMLNRQVAVKKMTRTLSDLGPKARELFMQEARTVAQLQHPAIVEIFDIVEESGDVYLVFELVHGKTTHQLLAENGKLPLARAKTILAPVCEALEYAHGRQLVHRDLKPANIMVTEQGHIKLMDFGIARSLATAGARQATEATSTRTPGVFARTQHVVGTPAYMAPEAEAGVVCKEGDVFSLGVTLYEIVTGHIPFGALAAASEKVSGKFAAATSVAPGLPADVDAVIALALKPDPRDRFRSAGEFAAALAAVS